MNVSKYTQRKGRLFTFLIFNICSHIYGNNLPWVYFWWKKTAPLQGWNVALTAKPPKHPCFASWMSNKRQSTPESWDELYIKQQVIKCKIWFKILHSGSCPDLFICWNTSQLYQLELLPPSQCLAFIILENDVIWRLFISKCQRLWFSHHPLKSHRPFLWCSQPLHHLMPFSTL